MDESEHFFSSFFEPESTHETYQSEHHKEEGPINEAPEEIKVETDEIDSYPEKCLRNHIGFSESHANPDTCGENGNIEDIESEASHVRIIKHLCDIDSERIDPTCEEDKEKTKLSIGCMNGGKDFCLPLKK